MSQWSSVGHIITFHIGYYMVTFMVPYEFYLDFIFLKFHFIHFSIPFFPSFFLEVEKHFSNQKACSEKRLKNERF